jgi:hypothetical protein
VELNFKSQMDQEFVKVRFFPNGMSDDFTIALESETGVRLLTLDPVTGAVEVELLR